MKTQRLWMPIWGAAWLIGALAGCGTERDTSERSSPALAGQSADSVTPSGQDYEFITFGGGTYGLVAVAKHPQITICLSGVSGSTQTQFEGWIKDSVMKWLAPLRAMTSDQIASTVEVTTSSSSGCDASVRVVTGQWGYTTISNNPVVTVGPSVPFGVVIHEFGHAFGLGDTYQNGTSGNCQPGQPQAVMCNISFSDLQPDDRTGLAEVFKRAFPNDRPGQNPQPTPTPTPTMIPTPTPIPTLVPTPTPEPNDGSVTLDDADMRIAMFREGRLRQYRLYFSVIKDGNLPGLSVDSCIGTKDICQRTPSMWQTSTAIKIRGTDPRAKIFRSDDRATLRRNASVTVRASLGGVTKVVEFKASNRNPQ